MVLLPVASTMNCRVEWASLMPPTPPLDEAMNAEGSKVSWFPTPVGASNSASSVPVCTVSWIPVYVKSVPT